MSVTAQIPYKSYTAAPGAVTFSSQFRVILASDLVVRVNGTVVTTGFAISGLDAANGVDVTFSIPMTGGEFVELLRKVPLTRLTDYQQLGNFRAPVVNRDIDRLWMALQDAGFLNALAVLLPVGDAQTPMTIPSVADRSSKFLAFDALGKAIAAAGASGVPVSTFIATLLDDVDAAAARATLVAAGAGAVGSSGLTMNTARALLRTTAGVGPVEEATAAQLATFIGGTQQAGEVCYFATNSLPTGFLKCNGAAVSRTTYAALFAALVKSSTVTMTIASPGVITWNAHGRSANDPVKFMTTGALPTGLTAGTTYYVVGASITTNTFQVSATPGGTAINTSGTQSGTHTAIHAPFGDGDGSTTFNLPELRGEFLRGWDDGRAIDTNRAFGSSQTDAMQGHFHGGVISAITTSANFSAGGTQAGQVPANTTAPTSDGTNGTPRTAAETRPRSVALMACIKF